MRATFSHDQMPDLYRSADLFLHTKIRESFGNVYIEALSCGVPVVAHDDEVASWIFEGKATLVDTASQAELAQAIRERLEKPNIDKDASAWAHEHYAWKVVAERYAEFLAMVAQRSIGEKADLPSA